MNRWLARAIATIAAIYPFIVWFSLDTLPVAFLGLLLLALALGRLVLLGRVPGEPLLVAAGVIAMAAAGIYTLLSSSSEGLRFYPVLMSAAMLCLFGWSLCQPQSIIERIGRIVYRDFPPEAVAYTRRVTVVWCAFFLVNGLIALWTAVGASWATWTLYNGFLSYMLMGLLFMGEYAVRQRRLGATS
ncbi:MAG: hypothetical protein ACOCP9_02525 [Halofilum sp. (in: g-proteobacteria)]